MKERPDTVGALSLCTPAGAGAEVHIITAGSLDASERASVADKGDEWTARLRELLRRDRVHVEHLDVALDDIGCAAVNGALLDVAHDALASGEGIVVAAVLGSRRDGRDHTASWCLGDQSQ